MKITKWLLSHYDLGILEVDERGGSISEWGVTPLPLRLMGSMTLLREGGSHPNPKS